MARSFGRQVPDQGQEGPPPEWMAPFENGELGPWKKADRAEFYHAGAHAQEWFLRLDRTEVELIQKGLALISLGLSVVKWGKRAFWAFTAGLGAALTAGENLQKLPGMISGVVSVIKGLF